MSPATRAFATYLSDLGDSAVIIAVLLMVTCYLLYCKCYREAKALFLSVGITGAIITTLKVVFLSCGNDVLSIRSPSGHAAMTVAFYGMYCILMYRHLEGWKRFIPVLVIGPLILGVAATRILLNLHTTSEVIVGLLVGTGIVTAVWYMVLRGHKAAYFNTIKLLLFGCVVGAFLHGVRMPAEPLIKQYASLLQERSQCDEKAEKEQQEAY